MPSGILTILNGKAALLTFKSHWFSVPNENNTVQLGPTESAVPVIVGQIQFDNTAALPATVTVRLTFNGTAESSVTYSTSAFGPGDRITVAQQVSNPLATTGRYLYQFDVTLNYPTTLSYSFSGAAFVV